MKEFVIAAALFAVGLLVPTVEAGCSLYCAKDDQPVCAHNPVKGYKNFPDKCALEQANHCGKEDWILIHPGACTPTEIGGCLPHFWPVCGFSPTLGHKSFLSKCYLDIESQLTDFQFDHDGACSPLEVPPSECPGFCTLNFDPVCGYNPVSKLYHTFSNECFLQLENKCHYGSYVVKHTGECNDKELEFNCKLLCTEEYKPVCGFSPEKGFKTFGNLCQFFYENACPKFDSDYKLLHPGACETYETASFCKPGFCPDLAAPVCASSPPYYRTFLNKCLFNVENKCKYGDFQIVHPGDCTVKEHEESCSAKCSPDKVPVCGFSPARGYKTFWNACYIKYENACYGSDYGLVKIGECKKGELELICGKDYCLKYKGKKVCGLSPTKGYTSFDNECFLYSENTCKYGDYKFVHFEECTKKELGLLCLPEFCHKPGTPVCGYSKKTGYFTFLNECYLNKENFCKGGEFILKHEGNCTDHELGGKCPVVCSHECDYICGLSPTLGYKTFYNKCALDAENACNGGDYKFSYVGECTKKDLEKNCKLQCTYDYKPVCALSPTKGYQTFPNKCLYILDVTCYGSDYKFEYGGVCKPPVVIPPPPKCEETVCTTDYNPVCAYSKSNNIFKTFSNKCLFDIDNKCKYDYDFIFAHEGACTNDELVNNCHRSCDEKPAPVCAVSPTQGYKTFINTCTLLLAISCYRSDFSWVHDGKCTPQEAPVCTKFCTKIFDPVCAFSPSKKEFKTFNNKCLWEYENQCNYGDYILVFAGSCTEREILNDCKRPCPKKYAPVCGYSPTRGYKTYENTCTFVRDLSCLGCDYVFSNEGKCKYPEGPQKDCPVICPSEKKPEPVCAFSSSTKSFKTFFSLCLLNADNKCNYGDYVFVHPGKCTKDESGHKCYRKCPLVYKPVCGVQVIEGFRTFPSLCELEVANKCDGADYSLAHVGKCYPKELGGSCNHNCPLYYLGVCGFSHIKGFKTFPNECFMDRENTCTLSDYKLAHAGKCKPEETGNKCNHVCQLIYSPICAKSALEGYKNFPNYCHMDRENSCFNFNFNFEHQGECFPWELCKNCKH